MSEQRNKYGLYDQPVTLTAKDALREQSVERLQEQMAHGAFIMSQKEAVQQGLLDEQENFSSDLILGEITLTREEAEKLGII